MHKHFSIKEALHFGWRVTRTHSALMFQVVLTLLALEVADAVVQKVLVHTPLGFLAHIVLAVIMFVLSIGATRIALMLARGQRAHYRNLMPPQKLIWPYLAASVLMALAVIGGLILLIIPGIWVAMRLSMTRFEVIDGARIRESLHKSWELTRGHALHLLLFCITLFLLNVLGAVLLLVGLLITIPVSFVAFAHVYLKLKGH